MKQIALVIFGVMIAFGVYLTLSLLGVNKEVHLHNHESCRRIELDIPSEDLVSIGEYVIGATADFPNLAFLQKSAEKAKPGSIFALHVPTENLIFIQPENFPDRFRLNGHGISLLNNQTLYVISHGLNHGGEIIFVFDLFLDDGLKVVYKDYIALEGKNFIFNSLHVIDERNFFISHAGLVEIDDDGVDMSIASKIKGLVSLITFNNGILHCRVEGNSANCEYKTRNLMPNGIALFNNWLLVAQTITSEIDVFEIKENFDLNLVDTIKLNHISDNLRVVGSEVYVAGFNRAYEMLRTDEFLYHGTKTAIGGSSRITYNKGWIVEEILVQDKLMYPSVCTTSGKFAAFGSFLDPAVLICEVNLS